MAPKIAAVFGGSGFLGRRIVARLTEEGLTVRVAARDPGPAAAPGEAVPVVADVRDEAAVAAAIDGAEAVVNAVGLYVERGGDTFRAVHVEAAGRVARQAAHAGARLVHISGIGADPGSRSGYVRARAAGEAAVRDAFAEATILRPSVLFGPGDAFFNTFAKLARAAPVLPLFGAGDTKLQPVFVDDVAEAVVRALACRDAEGRTYELGGPGTYSYRELLRFVLERVGRQRAFLPLPFAAWHVLAAAASLFPGPPLTRDQVILMEQDNVVAPDALGFADLGIAPTPVEEVLPRYL